METDLFSWEDYEEKGNLRVIYKACTLKQNLIINGLGTGWPRGTKIQEIEIDYLNGTIQFVDVQDGERVILDSFIGSLNLMREI